MENNQIYRVLVVCTANVCRSPLGEAILKNYVSHSEMNSYVEVSSSGIWATDGQKPSALTEEVARENGLDISKHYSQSINPQLIQNCDLILCMTPEHRNELKNIFPEMEGKIFTLKEFNKKQKPENETIDDPIGLSFNFYRRIYQEIEAEVKRVFPEIKSRAQKKLTLK